MSDRPILFSGPMVRALLEGRKTQTRRVIKPRPWNSEGDTVDISRASAARISVGADGRSYVAFDHPRGGPLTAYVAPYVVGDRLWVRETWAPTGHGFLYGADWLPAAFDSMKPWRPSIFMPRAASRLTLAVTEVRVQRLQEIGALDAESEGVQCDMSQRGFVDHFRNLWNRLNAGRGFGWDANPWIVAVTFTVERRNIDLEAA